MYYRIPRKQKKQEKANIIKLTNKDLENDNTKLTKKEIKSLIFVRKVMCGVIYHSYNFKKT